MMPSLSETTPTQWLRMKLSTQLTTYAIFDWLRGRGEKPLYNIDKPLRDMLDADWIGLGPEGYYVTLAGQDHLSS